MMDRNSWWHFASPLHPPPPLTSPLHKISFISIGDSLYKMSNPVFYLFIFQVHFKTKCSYIYFKNSRPKAVFFKK